MVKTIIFSLLVVISTSIFARDITKPYIPNVDQIAISEEVNSNPKLQGIHIASTTRKALINDIWYKTGETFDGIKVISIKSKSVKILHNGERKTLSL